MSNASLEPHYDSLMEILFAQYSDLEALLRLARREAVAVEQKDFDQILDVVTERASLGDRLEVYHRQLAELRARLGPAYEPLLQTSVVTQSASLVNAIQIQDNHTRPLLIAARDEAMQLAARVDQSRRNLGAYARHGQGGSIACDERI
jgi:hypothetical protein